MNEFLSNKLIALLREDNERKMKILKEDVEHVLKNSAAISCGLKVVHKKSGILYTVKSIAPEDVILTTPEGEDFMVHKDEFEANYALD